MLTRRSRYRAIVIAGLAFAAASAVLGMQPGGPPPGRYKVTLRYRIAAPRDEHVAQYKAMVEHLARIGFDFDPKLKPFPNTDYEDPTKDVLTGFIDANNALRSLDNPSVASLLLIPANYQIPADPRQLVRVRLELASGLPSARQQTLFDQVRVLLAQLEFKESTGYDHRGYSGKTHSRIVGSIPAENLDSLLKDLRTQPSGWLGPHIELETLPFPVRQFVPIVVTEVVPGAVDEPPPSVEKRGQAYLDKITPDFWAMLTSKDEDTKIVRAEIILSYVPESDDESYRTALQAAAPSLFIEGRLGPVVTALIRVNQSNLLAALPQVSVVRLARPALVRVDPSVTFPTDNEAALQKSGVAALHQKGYMGQWTRIGIVDSDFRGHEELVRAGKLPKWTQLIDLTTEFNSDLLPDPQLSDDKSIGHGTHCALATALAAPQAELTLIRIDPASLLQLQLVAKIVSGEAALDEHIRRRHDELRAQSQELMQRRDEIMGERADILRDFTDDSEHKRLYGLLGPVIRGWLFTPREWHAHRMEELERDREQHRRLEDRFQKFYSMLGRLKGLQIVCTSLVWNDGYPLAGNSALSRWLDEQKECKALWLASVGNTRAQTWAGTFRDAVENGVMEFVPADCKLPANVWTSELSFFAWQPQGNPSTSSDLPAGAKLRVSMQWNEPHDPSYFWRADEPDRYLKPLADISLTVLRQRDPTAKTVPADDLEIVARSTTPAFRIENTPSGSTYEQIVEFNVTKGGRFALQVKRALSSRWELGIDPATGQTVLVESLGLTPTGIRPLDVPNIAAIETQWELRSRIMVNVIDPIASAKGRVIFRDFWTEVGAIPIIADARSVIAVGAASPAGVPQPYSAAGTPGTLWSFVRPNVYAFDSLSLVSGGAGSAYGTSLSTPFAAGMSATKLSAGEKLDSLRAHLEKMCSSLWHIGKGH